MADGTVAGDSASAVRAVVPTHPGPGQERQVSTDQANLSIAVDESYLVKWLHPPIAAERLDVLRRLRDAGFGHTPAFVGSIDDGDRVLAVVHELIPGSTDGWVWYVDDVLGWLDGRAPLAPLVDTAAAMGDIAAELHLALGPARPSPAAPQRDRIHALADQAFHLARSRDGDDAARLLRAERDVRRRLAALDGLDLVAVQRVHGDLHAGQFLRCDDRLWVIDLDGDPMVTGDGLVEQSPERDVAALVQSIDHVGRVAARRRPDADVEPFIAASSAACLAAYRHRRDVDDRLLGPFRVAQELHEHVYAWTRLPVWAYVPDAAMQRLLRADQGT